MHNIIQIYNSHCILRFTFLNICDWQLFSVNKGQGDLADIRDASGCYGIPAAPPTIRKRILTCLLNRLFLQQHFGVHFVLWVPTFFYHLFQVIPVIVNAILCDWLKKIFILWMVFCKIWVYWVAENTKCTAWLYTRLSI